MLKVSTAHKVFQPARGAESRLRVQRVFEFSTSVDLRQSNPRGIDPPRANPSRVTTDGAELDFNRRRPQSSGRAAAFAKS